MGMKHYICKHSLGLAIVFQMYDIKGKCHLHILGKLLVDDLDIVLPRFFSTEFCRARQELYRQTRFFALSCPRILAGHKRILNILFFLLYSLLS